MTYVHTLSTSYYWGLRRPHKVLLYDFFEDSTVELSRWRVVLNALEGQSAPDVEARHVSVCAEVSLRLFRVS